MWDDMKSCGGFLLLAGFLLFGAIIKAIEELAPVLLVVIGLVVLAFFAKMVFDLWTLITYLLRRANLLEWLGNRLRGIESQTRRVESRAKALAQSADDVELAVLERNRDALKESAYETADAIVRLLSRDITSLEKRLENSAETMASRKSWRRESYEAKVRRLRGAISFGRSRLAETQKRLDQFTELGRYRKPHHHPTLFANFIHSRSGILVWFADRRRLKRYEKPGEIQVTHGGELRGA